MSYKFIAYVEYKDSSDNNVFADPSSAPVVSAINGETGAPMAGATISKLDVGIYRCEITTPGKQDILFKVTTSDTAYADYALLDTERYFNLVDALVSLPGLVWAYTTRTLTLLVQQTLSSATIAGVISVPRGDTWAINFEMETSLVNKKVQLAIKKSILHSDEQSYVFIDTVNGLLFLNQNVADTPSNGSITIVDEDTGTIRINLEAVESAKLGDGHYKYGIQTIDEITDEVSESWNDKFMVTSDVVESIA